MVQSNCSHAVICIFDRIHACNMDVSLVALNMFLWAAVGNRKLPEKAGCVRTRTGKSLRY